MSSEIAISAHDLGKRYVRGTSRSRHDSLRDAVAEGVSHLLRRGGANGPEAANTFWALQHASFEIARGESVGIIGLNGAGKSTLLKILSRITTPTVGSARIVGRLGALLEVGTGFHQELTGRENVFLYGAILGMSREEIARKFDAIVEFSEIADFIDTPVKRYSSGMYVRLAFSVAAHLDPDILLLDEVLAVGDFTFQRKCLNFAHELERKGATILFVSHNMFSIKSMCQRVIYLKKGQIIFDGQTDKGLKLYEDDSRLSTAPWFNGKADPPIEFTEVALFGEDGQEKALFEFGERIKIRARYNAVRPIDEPEFLFSITRSDNILCSNFSTTTDGVVFPRAFGSGVIELETPPLKLVSEMYTLSIVVRGRGFQEMLSAQIGAHFHVRHPVFSPMPFGVYHEPGRWRVLPAEREAREDVVGSRAG